MQFIPNRRSWNTTIHSCRIVPRERLRASTGATLGIAIKRLMASRIPQPVDDRTYSYQNRRFSQYAWTNGVHYLPVDEVRTSMQMAQIHALEDLLL